MAEEQKALPLKCWDKVKTLNNAYDAELRRAASGVRERPIGFTAGLPPTELYEGLGITKIQGEWYGSRCGFAQKVEFTETAETCGFMHDVCSYARMTLGAMILDQSFDPGPFPKPDVIIGMEGLCNMHVKWMEIMARHLDVPMFVMDCPNLYFYEGELANWGQEAEKEVVNFFVQQEYDLLDFIERVLGIKPDEEKMIQACATSRRVRDLFDDVLELSYHVPSPASFRALFTFENCVVSLPCREATIPVLQSLKEELEERIRNGVSGIPREKARLSWYGQPPWYDLGVMRYFEGRGANFVSSPYLEWFGTRYWRRLLQHRVSDWMLDWTWSDPRNLHEALEHLAKHTICTYLRPRLDALVAGCVHLARQAKVDGTVWHYVRACKGASAFQPPVKAAIHRELGIPAMVIEGSPADPEDYSPEQVRYDIDIFLEKLLAGKQG